MPKKIASGTKTIYGTCLEFYGLRTIDRSWLRPWSGAFITELTAHYKRSSGGGDISQPPKATRCRGVGGLSFVT